MFTQPQQSGAVAELVAAHDRGISSLRLLVARGGKLVVDAAVGVLQEWGDDGLRLPDDELRPTSSDTVYDLASVTKPFTAALLVGLLADAGEPLDAPVGRYLPRFAGLGAGQPTVRHLLTHTAGFAPTWPGWRDAPDEAAAWAAFDEVVPEVRPGTEHRYSCLGYIVAGQVAEALGGAPLAAAMASRLLAPLGLAGTGYRPADPARCAATERQPEYGRGVVRGVVHDETAWRLGGVAGNAGLFATGPDLLAFAEALRRAVVAGGSDSFPRIDLLTTCQAPSGVATPYGQAAGLTIGDEATGASLLGGALGHTGFTGTWLLVVPEREISAVLLTNRVHPRRDGEDPNRVRRAIATTLASI